MNERRNLRIESTTLHGLIIGDMVRFIFLCRTSNYLEQLFQYLV